LFLILQISNARRKLVSVNYQKILFLLFLLTNGFKNAVYAFYHRGCAAAAEVLLLVNIDFYSPFNEIIKITNKGGQNG